MSGEPTTVPALALALAPAPEPTPTPVPALVPDTTSAPGPATTSAPGPVPIKPGTKTTEFWLSVIAVVVSSLLASGVLHNETTIQIIGAVSAALTALGYTAARTVVKSTTQSTTSA